MIQDADEAVGSDAHQNAAGDPSQPKTRNTAGEAESLAGLARDVVSSTRGYVGATLDLVAAEIRVAGVSGVLMLAAALAVVVLGTSFWLAGATALAVLFAVGEMKWVWALGGVSLVSALAAGLAFWYIIRTSRHLTFPLTRQLLAPQPAAGDSRETRTQNEDSGADSSAYDHKTA